MSDFTITDEQIDAAWEIARDTYKRSDVSWIANIVFTALKELGIKRCDVCNGAGKTYSRSSSMKEEPMEWKCPDCNGKGWVKDD